MSFDFEDRLLPSHVHAFVLAGGRSRRMGRDKARLPLDGEPLACLLAARLREHAGEVWLVAKRDSGLEELGVPMLYDTQEETALVHGIHVALGAPGPAWRFVVACDMPGVDGDVLHGLWECARRAGAPGSSARLPGSPAVDPLPSLWHADVARQVLPSWGLAARDWVQRAGLAIWNVPEALQARFANVNTPQEWSRYERGAREAAS